jgi:hypothetical protein
MRGVRTESKPHKAFHLCEMVTSVSKPVDPDPTCALKNVADLTSDSFFQSKDQPGPWICEEFHEVARPRVSQGNCGLEAEIAGC